MPISIRAGKIKSPIRTTPAFSSSPTNMIAGIVKEYNDITLLRRDLEELRQETQSLIEAKQKELNNGLKDIKGVHAKTIAMLQTKAEQADKYLEEIAKYADKKLNETEKEALARIQAIKIEHKGEKGDPGKDGENAPPVDEEKLIEKIVKKIIIPQPKDGKDADVSVVAEEVIKHIKDGKVKISTKHIDGFEDSQSVLRNFIARGSLHGGGDTVAAGTGISIVQGSDGKKIISATGGTSIPLSYLDTDVTLAADSDTKIASQHATKTYADTKMVNPMTNLGDMITGGVSGAPTRLGIGGSGTLLHGGSTPTYSAVVETDISLSNNTTNNVSTTKHGFTPILPNDASLYLNGQGNYSLPSGTTNSYTVSTFIGQTSVNIVHNFGTKPIVQVLDSANEMFIPYKIVHNSDNDFTVSFVESTTGTIIASVGSPQPQSVISVSGDYNVLVTDRIVTVTASGKTITLPTAVGNTGREFIIDNASTGDITVVVTGGELIQNEATQTLPPDSAMNVYSNGSGYRIY